jgi:hypothetical protein
VTVPHDLVFDFHAAETIAEYRIMAGNGAASSGAPTAWTFDYWDGAAWQVLDTQSGVTDWDSESEFKVFPISSPVSATRYRLHMTTLESGTVLLWLAAIQLRRSTTVDAAFSQFVWQAPGNDGDSTILVGARNFMRSDADYFDWELLSFDGFLSGTNPYLQAGAHGKSFLPLWNDPIPYWFIANGRRVIIIVKIGSQYEMAYLGFHSPYFTPAQLPYPMALGGSLALGELPTWDSIKFRWSNSSDEHRMPTHSDPRSTSVTIHSHHLRVRRIDGVWVGYESTVNDSSASTPSVSKNLIWPYRMGLSLLDTNLIADSYSLWPVMLCDAAPNTWGELDGVHAVSGQGLSAETLILIGEINHLALPNITRTDRDDWLAVALD